MKQQLKLILLSGALAFSAQAVQAQTCAAQPSCSELGYTLTSTSDCIGTVLKCPFDKSKYYCTTKIQMIQNMVLDWSKKKSINPVSSTYYVTDYGVIIGHTQDITAQGGYVIINGFTASNTGTEDMHTFFYSQVAPGDSVKAFGRNYGFYFIPYKK